MGKISAKDRYSDEEQLSVIGRYRKISKVLDLVSDVCGVDRKSLKSPVRSRKIVDARRVYAVLCRNNFGLPLQFIGHFIKKDHATILYYVRQHEGLIQTDMLYKHNYSVAAYALEENEISLEDDGSYIDALIAENKMLREENKTLESKLETIQEAIK